MSQQQLRSKRRSIFKWTRRRTNNTQRHATWGESSAHMVPSEVWRQGVVSSLPLADVVALRNTSSTFSCRDVYSVPVDVWRELMMPCFAVRDLAAIRTTSRSFGMSIVSAREMLHRLDALLEGHKLTGIIDIERAATGAGIGGLQFFQALLQCCYLLEQGATEWRMMRHFIRAAACYRLTPDSGLPLKVSAQLVTEELPTLPTDQPLMMAIYRLIGPLLTYPSGYTLALRDGDDEGTYRLGSYEFRVVPPTELPPGHRYAHRYKAADPVVRLGPFAEGSRLLPSFSSLLFHCLCERWHIRPAPKERTVLYKLLGHADPRYRSLLTSDIPDEDGIVADSLVDNGNLQADAAEHRYVLISGYRPDETSGGILSVGGGSVSLLTNEVPIGLADWMTDARLPVAMPPLRRVLRPFNLEWDIIDSRRLNTEYWMD